jgi:putative PIN family toxin of toxin-antitoxin system
MSSSAEDLSTTAPLKLLSIVVDTNVVIAGLRARRGASFLIVSAMLQNRIGFLISVPLLLEYEEIMKRAEPDLLPHFADFEKDVFLNGFAAFGKQPRIFYLWRPFLRDPDDDMIVELAVAGSATHIVTSNATDFDGVESLGINVSTPQTFYRNQLSS